jgi:3-oxoacyl-[acyl-carrier protein] reductase
MFDLSGKRALVTGASGAIGAAIARALAAQGALVGLSGTRAA